MIVQRMKDPLPQRACMQAYNRWLTEFCAAAPRRLFGVGQTAGCSVEATIEDVKTIKAQGIYGVYLPRMPKCSGMATSADTRPSSLIRSSASGRFARGPNSSTPAAVSRGARRRATTPSGPSSWTR
jgi:hypothetical protein